jgi:DNA-binding response OmpR family regulator
MKRHCTIDANQVRIDARRATAETSLEFGRCRVMLRQRLLMADGMPIELGTRAFELLLALLEAHGSLVTKEAAVGLCVAGPRRRRG